MSMNMEMQIDSKASFRSSPSSNFDGVDTKNLVSIEYPGYIENVDKMLASLGGEKSLSETYYKSKCRLQMTYRPEDIFAHNACADLKPCTGILIKVKRKRKKQSTNNVESECGYNIKHEIIGVVNDEYQFKSLMDYQYLPPSNLWNLFEDIYCSELGEKQVKPFFPPATFARIDTCGNYSYRPNPESLGVGKTLHDKFNNKNLNENKNPPRKKRHSEAMASLYHIENVPDEPTENSKTFIQRLESSTDEKAVNIIRQLFDERPIWSKLALSCHVKVSFERLKKILSYFAYYWLSGPWRTLWCKFGYDPRKDANAKIYQMIDFRVRESIKTKGMFSLLQPKRTTKDYVPRNLQFRPKGFTTADLASSLQVEENNEKLTIHSPYIFSSEKVPESRNSLFQLCDIHDVDVQKIVNGSEYFDSECKEREGWYLTGTMALIRQQMGKTVIKLLEKEKTNRKGLSDENFSEEIIEDAKKEKDENVLNFHDADTDVPPSDSFSFLQLMNDDDIDEENYASWFQDDDFNNDI